MEANAENYEIICDYFVAVYVECAIHVALEFMLALVFILL